MIKKMMERAKGFARRGKEAGERVGERIAPVVAHPATEMVASGAMYIGGVVLASKVAGTAALVGGCAMICVGGAGLGHGLYRGLVRGAQLHDAAR